jgi:hypothetical protein
VLLGSRWPTAKAGATYTALLVVLVLVPGLLVLWCSLLLLKLQQKARRKYCKLSSSAQEAPATVDLQYISSAGGAKAALHAATAVAVAASVSDSMVKVGTAVDGGLQLHLPAVQKQQHEAGTVSADSSTVASEAARLLQQPHDSASVVQQQYDSSTAVPVELGRPPLQQLVKGWLATQQQLATHDHSSSSSSSGKRSYTVYAMGPEQLVQSVQQLCCDMTPLRFVRKTHHL